MCPMILISACLMFYVNNQLEASPLPYFISIFFIGFTLGGPYNMVASVCANDLAK
jgi:sugar phosphate permease